MKIYEGDNHFKVLFNTTDRFNTKELAAILLTCGLI